IILSRISRRRPLIDGRVVVAGTSIAAMVASSTTLARSRSPRAGAAWPRSLVSGPGRAEQRADRRRLHRAEPAQDAWARDRAVERRGDRPPAVGGRRRELHVAGEGPGVAVHGAAARPVPEHRQPGGVEPGTR